MDYVYMSEEGLAELLAELKDLRGRGRKEAAAAIAEAREKGDLSENAEYDAAKNAQGMLEKKISELEAVASKARVIDKSKLDTSKVTMLSNVEIKNLNTSKVVTYTLVSANEADFLKKKISINSPIGEGLLGKKVGDIAKVKTPGGLIEFEVLSINQD